MINSVLQVSHNFSKAVSNYIKEIYKINTGACLTTRIIYTAKDLFTLASENSFQDDDLKKKRLDNFIYVNALYFFNTIPTIEKIASTKTLKDEIIILPLNIIREILVLTEPETLDSINNLMVDCVMCTVKNVDNIHIILVDYLSFV